MPSAEDLARRAAAKERAGQRLREMAAAKRAARAEELEGEVAELRETLLLIEAGAEEEEIEQAGECKGLGR